LRHAAAAMEISVAEYWKVVHRWVPGARDTRKRADRPIRRQQLS